MLNNDLSIDLSNGQTEPHSGQQSYWRVHLIDTGNVTEIGGRIKRLQPLIGEERFMLAYGDGVANVDIKRLVAFHQSHGKLATITAVRPPFRFGKIVFDGDRVLEFAEKPQTTEGWINGSFFVLEPGVFDYIEGDEIAWEREPLQHLAADGQLMAYKHDGFWQPMDTLREKRLLSDLWEKGDAPWKVWK